MDRWWCHRRLPSWYRRFCELCPCAWLPIAGATPSLPRSSRTLRGRTNNSSRRHYHYCHYFWMLQLPLCEFPSKAHRSVAAVPFGSSRDFCCGDCSCCCSYLSIPISRGDNRCRNSPRRERHSHTRCQKCRRRHLGWTCRRRRPLEFHRRFVWPRMLPRHGGDLPWRGYWLEHRPVPNIRVPRDSDTGTIQWSRTPPWRRQLVVVVVDRSLITAIAVVVLLACCC